MSRSSKKAPFVEAKLFARIVAMNEKKRRLTDSLSGLFHTDWKRSITVFIIDEGPLNLIGVANMTASAASIFPIISSMSSWKTQSPVLQRLHPVQWAIPSAI